MRREGVIRGTVLPTFAIVALLLVVALFDRAPLQAKSSNEDLPKPTFNNKGQLNLPEGYREWVYIGTPLTPNELNPPEAPFPEFHNVYIHPDDFEAYKKTGKFPDGTVIIKELVTVGSKAAVSGKGYFMGEFVGLEATIKDSKRFKDEPGNWAYFSFGHSYPLAKTAGAFPTGACNACHDASAEEDWVFTQYYPVLRAAKGSLKQKASKTKGEETHDATCPICREKLSRFPQTGPQPEPTRVSVKEGMVPAHSSELFPYLQSGGYKSFAHESKIHPSTGPHDNVKTYLNPILDASMKAGNSSHPEGAAAVKELFKEGEMYGWAAMVKTDGKGAGGSAWYWYEVVSTTDPDRTMGDGNEETFCYGCHSLGRDFVRISYPFE